MKHLDDLLDRWEQDDKYVRGVMDGIVKEVSDRSKASESAAYANVQGNLQEGGTYDADGNLVCGVYL